MYKYISNKYCLNQHYDLIPSDKNKEGKITSMDPPGTIEMYITDQSSITSPSSEETFLKTFGNIISNEINTINGEEKICIISFFFWLNY